MPYRILVLGPVRDEAAARCEAQARQSPALQGCEFEHIYAAEHVGLDDTVPMERRILHSQQKALDEDALLQRLNERVTAFQADILLVNSGALFQHYPDETMEVLRTVKTLHPTLRIGFHPRAFERQGPRPFFEYTREIGDLMAAVFADAAH